MDFNEFAAMIDKKMTVAWDEGKDCAYLDGLRDALKIAEYLHEEEEKEHDI